MKTYACEFYEWPGGTPARPISGMDEILNKRTAEGWTAHAIIPVPIGFLIVFEREKA